ncbi:hypothetical protein ACFVWN_07510 [Nocardiopsis flavescens]
MRIERHRRRHGTVKGSREVVFAVTDLDKVLELHGITPDQPAWI